MGLWRCVDILAAPVIMMRTIQVKTMEDFLQSLARQDLVTPLARLVLILLTLALTLVVQRLARVLTVRLVKVLVHFGSRIGRYEAEFAADLNHKLARPVEIIVVMIGLRVALVFIELGSSLVLLANRVTISVVTVAIFWAILQVTNVITQYYVTRSIRETSALDETIVRFGRQVAIVLIFVFALTLLLGQWGQDVGALIAGLGIASLAVALAAQDALANVIAYFAILADAPFKVGDFIIVEDLVKGRVQSISFRSTRVRTLDYSVMAIPNQTIANANVINWARVRKRRLDMLVGLTYSTTAEQMEQVIADIRDMLNQHDDVTTDRIVVDFIEYGESSLNLRLSFLMRAYSWEDLEAHKTDINLRLMRIFDQNGVSVAFPTRTLHIASGGFPGEPAAGRDTAASDISE